MTDVDVAPLPAGQTRPGPCWHDCIGKVAYPAPGLTGQFRISCTSEFNRHTGIATVVPAPSDLEALARLRALDVADGSRQCRACGCTELYGCTPQCGWAEADLCTGCAS